MSLTKDDKLKKAQEILGYDFSNKELLWEALSPPGAHGTANGNVGLASIGPHAMHLVLKTQSYKQNESPAAASDKLTSATNNAALATVYKVKGLNDCLNPNPSAWGDTAPKTAASVVNALVGLVSLQEDGRLEQIANVMQKLGIIESGAVDLAMSEAVNVKAEE